jgi:hypothetical protein
VCVCVCVCVWVGVGVGARLASYAGSRSERRLFEPLLAVTAQAAAVVIM